MDFPEIITRLPRANVPVAGLKVHMVQGDRGLVGFFHALVDVDVPSHSHKGQWGTVVAGEVELTVGDETARYVPGDSYYIPAGAVHSARLPAGTKLVEFFEEPDRFKPLG